MKEYVKNMYIQNLHQQRYSVKIERTLYKSSHPNVFYNKGAFENFTKFTGKHLCQSLFFNKVASGLQFY